MTFLNAGLLVAGLAAVSIPILIHLLMRQRRKPVRWAAMRFLMEAYRKQRRRLRLQQLILLATRCLVVALIALALGRPLLEAAGLVGSGAGRSVYLLVDNGIASSARLDSASALDRHKQSAREALASLGEGDRAGLITLGGPAEPVVVPASADLAAVRRLVDAIESIDGPTDMRSAFDQLRTLSTQQQSGPTVALLISDFARGSADLSSPLSPALAEVEGLRVVATSPATDLPGNVQITSVDPLRSVVLSGGDPESAPDEQQQVRIRLRRTGAAVQTAQVTTVRLRVSAPRDADDASSVAAGLGASTTVSWRPGQEQATASVQISAATIRAAIDAGSGRSAVLIAEIDRDALKTDNIFRQPVALREALQVGIIAQRRFGRGPSVDQLEAADWFRIALEPQIGVPIDTIDANPSAIDLPLLSQLDAAILTQPHLVTDDAWAALGSFVEEGGMLLITPPSEDMANLWTDALSTHFGLEWRLAREPVIGAAEPMQLIGENASTPLLALINAELPRLTRNITIDRALAFEESPDGAQRLIDRRNPETGEAEPWLVAQRPLRSAESSSGDRGLVVFMASSPDAGWTNLPLMPLMVPLTQELIRQGVGQAAGADSVIAGTAPSVPSGSTRLIRSDESLGTAGIPVGSAGTASRPIRNAGTYRALDDVDRERAIITVNADTRASDLTVQPAEAVEAWLAEATGGSGAAQPPVAWVSPERIAASLERSDGGSPISLPLLIAALALAAAELVMARFFSHAETPRTGAQPIPGGA